MVCVAAFFFASLFAGSCVCALFCSQHRLSMAQQTTVRSVAVCLGRSGARPPLYSTALTLRCSEAQTTVQLSDTLLVRHRLLSRSAAQLRERSGALSLAALWRRITPALGTWCLAVLGSPALGHSCDWPPRCSAPSDNRPPWHSAAQVSQTRHSPPIRPPWRSAVVGSSKYSRCSAFSTSAALRHPSTLGAQSEWCLASMRLGIV